MVDKTTIQVLERMALLLFITFVVRAANPIPEVSSIITTVGMIVSMLVYIYCGGFESD